MYGFIQAPLDQLHIPLNFTHPTDILMLYLKTAFVGGAILACPFVLFQLWLFISPGLYAHEKRYVWPFMAATIGLFLAGAYFGYRWVLPGAIKVLVLDYGRRFHPILTIEDYTGFFLAIILGLGIAFELPVLMFFLALFDLVDARFLLRNFKYGILVIFIIAGVICPLPDPLGMCLFAVPLLLLYLLGVANGLPGPPVASQVEGQANQGAARDPGFNRYKIRSAFAGSTRGSPPFNSGVGNTTSRKGSRGLHALTGGNKAGIG